MKCPVVRFVGRVLLAALLLTGIEVSLLASDIGLSPALAYNPPSAPAQAYYVDDTWSNPESFNGMNTTYAYQLGYTADVGQPTGYSYIVVDFGRQYFAGSDGWGVCVFSLDGLCTGHFHTDTWVQSVAQDFMNGYNDGHTTASFIVVGTNNSDYPWLCDNSGSISPLWQSAGLAWGTVVAALGASPPPEVAVRSGSDIESWQGETGFGTWSACGLGGEAWYTGYESETTAIPNGDYGTEAWAESSPPPTPTIWTQQQVYDMVYGRTTARGVPDIYCTYNASQWVGLRDDVSSYVLFWGVTSDNAGSTFCGTKTLTWYQSWTTFNSYLTNNTPTPYPNDLLPGAIAYHLAVPTALPTSTATPTP